MPLFHAEAFSEAVINAILHNHWVEENAPMFTVFKDRIEILSRGKLPPKQTIEGFYLGESVSVNKKLSDLFLRLHISERSGRGVPKIVEVYGKEAIEFHDNTILVKIPLERLEQGEEVNGVKNVKKANFNQKNERSLSEVLSDVLSKKDYDKMEQIILYLEKNGEISPKDAERVTGKSSATVRRYLKSLSEVGVVVAYGSTTNIIYRLV